jgi:hypothetical protein
MSYWSTTTATSTATSNGNIQIFSGSVTLASIITTGSGGFTATTANGVPLQVQYGFFNIPNPPSTSIGTPPILIIHAQPDSNGRLITINDSQQQPLATIDDDGTVHVAEHGSNIEAAKSFYSAIEYVGKLTLSEVKLLQNQLALAKSALSEIHDSIRDIDVAPKAQKIKKISQFALEKLQ